jgi:hypothetical protein
MRIHRHRLRYWWLAVLWVWIVGDPNAQQAGNEDPIARVVDLKSVTSFRIASSNNTIQGLDIRNTLPSATAEQTPNIIFIRRPTVAGASPTPTPGGPPFNNRINAVLIDGGNRSSCQATGSCTGNRDLINVDGTGNTSTPAVIVSKVRGHSGLDKGVKVASGGVMQVQDSWFHNNYAGGLQATQHGWLRAYRNTVEQSGRRVTDAFQVDAGANGISSNSGAGNVSVVETDGNVVRNNVLLGSTANSTAEFIARNDYLCGNGANGIRAISTVSGTGPLVIASGLGSAYNGIHGATVQQFRAPTSFGGGSSSGRNAFVFQYSV